MSETFIHRLFGVDRLGTYHSRYTFRPGSSVIHEGPFHAVLRVYDLAQEMPVTIKVYDAGHLSGDSGLLIRTMWQSEVRVLLQLIPYQWRRPGLVRFVEGDEDEPTATLFVSWEDAYRLTLADVLRDPALAPAHLEELGAKVNLMAMLVEALYELHAHGIIHREISPEAICLWTERPARAAFTQFGMSVFLNNFLWADAPDRFAAAGMPPSAMAYWAPERLAFLTDSDDLVQAGEDYRQDFFSLGLAMTEWFTRPFAPDAADEFLGPSGYDAAAHQGWVINDVFGRIYQTPLTHDEAAEAALKELLFGMVQFDPDVRFATAGQLLRAAREVQSRWRERSYRDLCKRPFRIIFDVDTCAEHLDIGSPREHPRTTLSDEAKRAAIWEELQADVSEGVLQIGFVPTAELQRDRFARDRDGQERWFLRGREHVYRLERFRSPWHQGAECPWLAYLFQVVRGMVPLEQSTRVPFQQVEMVPLRRADATKLINGGQDPGTSGRWDELLTHVRRVTADDTASTHFGDHVALAALREALEIQMSLSAVSTYAVDVVGVEPPEGVDGPRVVTLAYAPAADAAMLADHPYIRAFERTREERRPFAQWLRALLGSHRQQVELAAAHRQFAGRRRILGQLLGAEEPDVLRLRVLLPTGSILPWDSGLIRAASLSDERAELDRQRRALERLESDHYRLELLRAPAVLHVQVPQERVGWQIQLNGGADENKTAAVEAALTSHPAFFLQGPPGTGKTTAATEVLARVLAANPAGRILVAAQANEALDNLMEDALELLPHRERYLIVRVKSGNHVPGRPELRERQPLAAVGSLSRRATTRSRRWVERLTVDGDPRVDAARPIVVSWAALLHQRHSELERLLYRSANIVFATCSGSDLLNKHDVEMFDWVILEEAARAHPTEMLVPLMAGHRWVLIGDQAQLQPFKAEEFGSAFRARVKARVERAATGRDQDAPGRGAAPADPALLERSDRYLALFQHLFQSSPAEMHATLSECYRMHPTICGLVDRLFYRSEEAAVAVVKPAVTKADREHAYRATWAPDDWLSGRSVVWMDTSDHPARREEVLIGEETSRENRLEQEIIARLVSELRKQDPGKEIMLLSIYKRQRNRLAAIAEEFENGVRAHTIMSAQGKQADVVILSLVRSNTEEAPGLALGSIRQDRHLNVALSRAKRLLIVVGDRSHVARFGEASGRLATLVSMLERWPEPQDAADVTVAAPNGLVADEWLTGP